MSLSLTEFIPLICIPKLSVVVAVEVKVAVYNFHSLVAVCSSGTCTPATLNCITWLVPFVDFTQQDILYVWPVVKEKFLTKLLLSEFKPPTASNWTLVAFCVPSGDIA